MINIRHYQWFSATAEPLRQSGFGRLSQNELIAVAAYHSLRERHLFFFFYQIVCRYLKKAYCKYSLAEG